VAAVCTLCSLIQQAPAQDAMPQGSRRQVPKELSIADLSQYQEGCSIAALAQATTLSGGGPSDV